MKLSLARFQITANDKRWHRWFAWFPLVVSGHLVWLEIVERKWLEDGYYDPFWGYRLIGETDESTMV